MSSEPSKSLKNEEIGDEQDEESIGSLFQNKNKTPTTTSKSLSLKDAKSKKSGSKLKKEECDEDYQDITPNKTTPNNPKKKTPINKVKKEEADDTDRKKTPNSKVKKEEAGKSDTKKRVKESEQNGKKKKKGKGEEQKVVKKEKKVYDMPGQKRDPPEERDPLRIFYETLYEQIPTSEMAAFWMMECGLLPKDIAKKLYEKKQKKNQQQRLGSPMKTVVNVKKNKDLSVSVKKKQASSPVSTSKKKTPDSKEALTKAKKRKIVDESEGDGSDDDFVLSSRKNKKQKA